MFFGVLIVVSALSSYWFDPWGYFRINGFRSSSFLGDRVWGEERFRKALLLPAVRAETLIAGTSRVGMGFDVDDPDIQRYLGRSFNLGISAATFDEMDAYIRYAIGNQAPRTLLIGLDFGEFFTTSHGSSSFLDLGDSQSASYLGPLQRFGYALWSKGTLYNMMRMTFSAHDSSLYGTYNKANWIEWIRELGLHGSTLKAEEAIVAVWKQKSDWTASAGRLASLDRLLNDACNLNIKVKLFISPYHVRQLLLFDSVELWESFLSWKRKVTEIVEQRDQASCRLMLMDFSRITSFTSESFSSVEDKQNSVEWYFESSHYKPALGVKIVERLWGMESAPVDFGVELNSETIEQEILQMRNELKRYKEDHPEVADELRKLAERY